MNPIGLNVLGSYIHNQNDLEDWVRRSQPSACVVMDAPSIAQNIRQISPKTIVIHRAYNPNDSSWEFLITPQQWLDIHFPYTANGVYLQVFNEPNRKPEEWAKFNNWLIELIDLATARGVRLCIGNFAVGTPDIKDIEAGYFDSLIRKLSGSIHILGLHEYFYDNPVTEYPYLCGRFEFWIDRALTIGVARPRIVITEHGHDLGNKGWKTFFNGDQEKYWNCIKAARNKTYKKYAIPTTIFCYGYGAGNQWETWDIEGADYLKSSMIAYQEDQLPMPTYPDPSTLGAPIMGVVVKTSDPSGVNVRQEPSTDSAIIGKVVVSDKVTYRPKTWTQPDSIYTWTYLDSRHGWTFQGAVIAPVDIAPTMLITDIPFVDQVDPYSNLKNNDCFLACASAWTQMVLGRVGYGAMPLLTVNYLVAATPLATKDAPLTLTDAEMLLSKLGVKYLRKDNLTIDVICSYIDVKNPPILLGNYHFIDVNSKEFGHFFVATGYVKDAAGKVIYIIINDSYHMKASYYVPAARMEMCLTQVSTFAVKPNQGFVLR